jgi:hypothetical protein
VLEHALGARHVDAEAVRGQAVLVDHHHFAGLDLADVLRAENVQGAALRREDPGAFELAEAQRPEPVWVADADQRVGRETYERVRAAHPREGLPQPSHEILRTRAREQVDDDLAVDGRLEDGAQVLAFLAKLLRVHEVAVVRDRDRAVAIGGDERLEVRRMVRTRGGVTVVPDGARSGQRRDDVAREDLRDQTAPAVHMEPTIVRGADACALLAAMLQRVEAQVREPGRFGMAEDPEDAALSFRIVHVASLTLRPP